MFANCLNVLCSSTLFERVFFLSFSLMRCCTWSAAKFQTCCEKTSGMLFKLEVICFFHSAGKGD